MTRKRHVSCGPLPTSPALSSSPAPCPPTTMSLRRFAQTNNAGVTATSPRSSDSSIGSTPTTPNRPKAGPSTPRTRLVYPHSPLTSPSLSANVPFDWEAARARKPPPYASPLAGRRRSMHPLPHATTVKKAVRKKGIIEKCVLQLTHVARLSDPFQNHVYPIAYRLPDRPISQQRASTDASNFGMDTRWQHALCALLCTSIHATSYS